MGGAVSAGETNDELIDNLVEAKYIKSQEVERIFRAVDRGDYYLDGCKENAYQDLAWKHGVIHLSAPCIYSEVMESLKLEPGMSFLNLGSGTGYLSTMAGLILGTYGTNHGIELHEEVVEYAKSKLDEFQTDSPALDKYEFCVPSFVVGNCLLLDSTVHQYDRVYCGASCPTEHENFMKNLVRVGGILVMPINDHLLQVKRTGETSYEIKSILPVSFASLIPPTPKESLTSVKLPESQPLILQDICRSTIRSILRQNAETENPSLIEKKRVISPKYKRSQKLNLKSIVIPFFNHEDSENNNEEESSDIEGDVPAKNGSSQVQEDVSPGQSLEPSVVLDLSIKNTSEKMELATDNDSSDFEVVGPTQSPDINEPENGTTGMTSEGENETSHEDVLSTASSSLSDRLPPFSSDPKKSVEECEDVPPTPSSSLSDRLPPYSSYLKRSAEESEEVSDPRTSSRDGNDYPHCRSSTVIYKRVAFSDADSDEMDSDADVDCVSPMKAENSDLSGYTYFMRLKINQLPLPISLKSFLNFARPV